jgi:hypothetical protein
MRKDVGFFKKCRALCRYFRVIGRVSRSGKERQGNGAKKDRQKEGNALFENCYFRRLNCHKACSFPLLKRCLGASRGEGQDSFKEASFIYIVPFFHKEVNAALQKKR